MNWDYITGFFDADGSVSAIRVSSNKNRTLQICFHNNELQILKNIQKFILEDINIKGTITLKKAKKDSHSDQYELKYVYQRAYKVSLKLNTLHPKKKHRIEVYKKIQEVTKRNGKYTSQEEKLRSTLIEEFFKKI